MIINVLADRTEILPTQDTNQSQYSMNQSLIDKKKLVYVTTEEDQATTERKVNKIVWQKFISGW